MSADALALAARAAGHYAGVRGPWLHPTTMVLEPDPTRPRWLIVRDSHPARGREALLFDPLPRKEIPMPEPEPKPDVAHAWNLIVESDGARLSRALRHLEEHELARLIDVLEEANS